MANELLALAARLMRVEGETDAFWRDAAADMEVAAAGGQSKKFPEPAKWAASYIAQRCARAMGWESYSDQGMEGRTLLLDGSKDGIYLHDYQPWENDAQAEALLERYGRDIEATIQTGDRLNLKYALVECVVRDLLRRRAGS